MTTERKRTNGRGSAEAVEKRRAARQLNAIFEGNGKPGSAMDGRTEKRRRRLLKELKNGRNGRPLKAIEIVSHVDELMSLGETLSSLKKHGVRSSKVELPADANDVILQTQAAYDFRPEAWKIFGIQIENLTGRRRKGAAASRRDHGESPGNPAP